VDDSSHLGTNCFLVKKNLDMNSNWNQHVRKEEEEEEEEEGNSELLNKEGEKRRRRRRRKF
jgi:hypothetical protein